MINNHLENKRYTNLVSDILENEEFTKLSSITHHGSNRFDHCLRVSYWSYKVGKALRLDYEKIARAGLLHDFFIDDNTNLNRKDKTIILMNHPQYALENASKYFDLTDMEKDIILTHMFPVSPKRVPKYLESWIVDIVDDFVAIYEKTYIVRRELSAATSFLLIFIINYFR